MWNALLEACWPFLLCIVIILLAAWFNRRHNRDAARKGQNPRSIRFATLLHKPVSSRTGFKPDYVAFDIPSKFIIGYGLDLDGKARNLKDIYVIKES